MIICKIWQTLQFDVYVTGKYNNNPCYWKNTQLVLLDNGGLTNGVAQKLWFQV